MDVFIDKLRKGYQEALELAIECRRKYSKDVEERTENEMRWLAPNQCDITEPYRLLGCRLTWRTASRGCLEEL